MFLNKPATQQSLQNDGSMAIAEWRQVLPGAIDTLTHLAGATEDEFLQIGSQLQDFYLRSSAISNLANQLVEVVSGDQTQALIDRLREMLADMESYLTSAHDRNCHSRETLSRITSLLDQASHPLESFQKMTKALRMLGISTKIESSRLGDMGAGFQTLAQDVGKLSQLVSEKSANILGHRQVLASMINDNLRLLQTSESAQETKLGGVLANTSRSLEELKDVNTRCSTFGAMISSISGDVSGDINEVVSSLQMHDMTRQKIEHVVEALKLLLGDIAECSSNSADGVFRKKLVIEAGDVCELQSAQLQHATSDLCNAVASIAGNLRDVAGKQSAMAAETLSTTGVADSAGGSFVDIIRSGLATVTGVLAACSQSDREMSATLRRVAETMQEITGFVGDIEEIGSEIDLIALNSQIKAAHTGKEGAALGVLAEAIKRLSVDAINQTAAVSEILMQINSSTANLFSEATEETKLLGDRVSVVGKELDAILASLGEMNCNLIAMLSALNEQVGQLTEDIDRATGSIDVHTRVRQMSDQVESALDRIVENAREIEPASSEFKENLRHMEERYTMESERHIHEALARKRSGQGAVAQQVKAQDTSQDDSEFGNNVDLF
jgi:methyl-accepting chemotaxis protein